MIELVLIIISIVILGICVLYVSIRRIRMSYANTASHYAVYFTSRHRRPTLSSNAVRARNFRQRARESVRGALLTTDPALTQISRPQLSDDDDTRGFDYDERAELDSSPLSTRVSASEPVFV